MTYKERVQAIAGKIAKGMHPIKAQAGFTYEQLAQHYSSAAQIAAAEMTETIRDFLINYAIRPTTSTQSLDQYLKEQGLIPDDGQEVKNA